MRNALKIVVAAAAGFSLGYVVRKRQLDQSYQDISNSEIADLKAYYEKEMERRIDEEIQSYDRWLGDSKKEFSDAVEELPADVQIAEETSLVVAGAKALTDYSGMSKLPPRPEKPKHAAASTDPVLISADEFLSGESGYTQDTYIWYSEDNVLTDVADQVVEDEERRNIVGEGILEKLVLTEGEGQAVYFRNVAIAMDAEVNRLKSSYAREVLGLGDGSHSAS